MAAFGSREVRLRTRDLSVGGCCVETPLRPPLGERVGLVLHVDGAPVGTWAEVAWSTTLGGQSYVWGLRFVELEHDTAVRLAAYVDHCFAVDMLDSMLRADAAPEAMPAAPEFSAGDLEEVPTRLHRGASVQASPEFFPLGGGTPVETEATSEIDVESTLTSEVPHTHTVQVDVAELYRQMAQSSASLPTATLAAGWDMGGPEPIGNDVPAWSDAVGWNDTPAWDAAVEPPAFTLEPLPPPEPMHAAPIAAPVGDPYWIEAPEFPAHAPVAWPSTTQPVPTYAPQTYEENAFAKAVPFDAPQEQQQFYAPQPQQQYYPPQPQQQYYAPQEQQQYYPPQPEPQPQVEDPSAFDPSAFDPQSLATATLEVALESVPSPSPTPAPTITVELAPMAPADLLELKRKRIEEMLSSVPRRAGASESASKANATKADVPTDKQKRPRMPTGPQPAGLRELFDEALRELGREES